MRVSKAVSLFHEPFICPSCVLTASKANATNVLRKAHSRRLLRSPDERTRQQHTLSHQLSRNQVSSQLQHQIPRIYVRTLASQSIPDNASRKSATPDGRVTSPPRIRRPTASPEARKSSNVLEVAQSVVDGGERIIKNTDVVPNETDVLEVLDKCHALAEYIVFGKFESPPPSGLEIASLHGDASSSATSSLLHLQDEGSSIGKTNSNQMIAMSSTPIEVRRKATMQLSTLMHDLLLAPQVFISPSILELYVRTVCLLGTPQALPEIFHLYANKAIPTAQTSPIQYRPSKPSRASNAIPKPLADAALASAIATKNLPLALSIIDTTVKTPAWLRRKLLREASGPIVASAALPFIAYTAATAVGNYQMTSTASLATAVAFTGIMTYFVVTGTFGFVAMTTFNDHHERVRWRNIGLTQRWLREDERAMFDRVALGWGFKEKWRWGEEEGDEWEALREFCGRRGMILDRTELLEGME